jgi:hypothetical protein
MITITRIVVLLSGFWTPLRSMMTVSDRFLNTRRTSSCKIDKRDLRDAGDKAALPNRVVILS